MALCNNDFDVLCTWRAVKKLASSTKCCVCPSVHPCNFGCPDEFAWNFMYITWGRMKTDYNSKKIGKSEIGNLKIGKSEIFKIENFKICQTIGANRRPKDDLKASLVKED